jgi:hypothetical protein
MIILVVWLGADLLSFLARGANAVDQSRQGRMDDFVVDGFSPSVARQQSVALQQAEVLASLGGRQLAHLGDLMNGELPLHEDFDHAKPHGMGHDLQAFGGPIEHVAG